MEFMAASGEHREGARAVRLLILPLLMGRAAHVRLVRRVISGGMVTYWHRDLAMATVGGTRAVPLSRQSSCHQMVLTRPAPRIVRSLATLPQGLVPIVALYWGAMDGETMCGRRMGPGGYCTMAQGCGNKGEKFCIESVVKSGLQVMLSDSAFAIT